MYYYFCLLVNMITELRSFSVAVLATQSVSSLELYGYWGTGSEIHFADMVASRYTMALELEVAAASQFSDP